MWRVLTATVLLALASGSAAAAPCVDEAYYTAHGGKLVHLDDYIHMLSGLEDITCGHRRVGCVGKFLFSYVIRQDGTVDNVKVVSNGWIIDPADHARLVAGRISQMRYAPPRLGAKPVCVKNRLRYNVGDHP